MENTNKNDLICVECCTKMTDIFKIYNDGFKDIVQCVIIFYYNYRAYLTKCFIYFSILLILNSLNATNYAIRILNANTLLFLLIYFI